MAEPTITALTAWHLVAYASSRGVRLRRAPALVGATPPHIEDRVPASALAAAWEEAADALGPELPVRLAQARLAEPLSVVRFVSNAHPTIGDAARVAASYAPLVSDLWTTRAEPDGDGLRVVWHPAGGRWPDRRGVRLIAVYEVVDWTLIGRAMTRGAYRPDAVRVPWDDGGEGALAARVLGAPVHYGAPHLGISASAAMCALRLDDGTAPLRGWLTAQADAALARVAAADTWALRARSAVLACLPAPSLDAVARRLGVSPRTLHRRLADEGTWLRQIVDDVRSELARAWLVDRDIPEVADALGYADPRALRRAFRRWTGQSPSAWRRARARPVPPGPAG